MIKDHPCRDDLENRDLKKPKLAQNEKGWYAIQPVGEDGDYPSCRKLRTWD